MKQTQDNAINLYQSYLQQTKKEQSGKSGKRITAILPFALLLLVMLGVSGRLLLNNQEKMQEIEALDDEISTLSAAYEDAQALQDRSDSTAAMRDELVGARFTFELYPILTQDLFQQVRACAAGIFNVSQYAYDETKGVLVIDASAASVNEVPQFVQRLRDTGLFSLVQYTGYTSRDTMEYFCTVSCMLINESAYNFDELFDPEEDIEETDSDVDTQSAS